MNLSIVSITLSLLMCIHTLRASQSRGRAPSRHAQVIQYRDGSKYIGNLNNQRQPHGKGKKYWPKPETHAELDGSWRNGQIIEGKWVSRDRQYFFEGTFDAVCGFTDGKGKLLNDEKRVYQGKFKNGLKHDEHASLEALDGSVRFEGTFENNKFIKGWAKCQLAGTPPGWYEGEIMHGAPHGEGRMAGIEYNNTSEYGYEMGLFKNGALIKGTAKLYRDGVWYEGPIENEFCHGKTAIKCAASGEQWQADFENGKLIISTLKCLNESEGGETREGAVVVTDTAAAAESDDVGTERMVQIAIDDRQQEQKVEHHTWTEGVVQINHRDRIQQENAGIRNQHQQNDQNLQAKKEQEARVMPMMRDDRVSQKKEDTDSPTWSKVSRARKHKEPDWQAWCAQMKMKCPDVAQYAGPFLFFYQQKFEKKKISLRQIHASDFQKFKELIDIRNRVAHDMQRVSVSELDRARQMISELGLE